MAAPEPAVPPMQEQVVQAQAVHQESLLAKNNVVGVGVGYKESQGVVTDELAVVVLVQEKHPLVALAAEDVIPKELEGMKTDVIEVGYLRAQQAQLSGKDRYRPQIPSGVSIGHYKITAGTLGTIVKDKRTGEALILSNNHVLANSNDAMVGDDILQPGPIDGGKVSADVVARLERFVRLRYTDETTTPPVIQPPTTPGGGTTPTNGCDILGALIAIVNALASIVGSQQRVTTTQSKSQSIFSTGGASPQAAMTTTPSGLAVAQAVPTNAIDAALARPLDASMFIDQVQRIGEVNTTKPVALGMKVRKYGRTTEYTEGTVNLLNATVDIAYSTIAGQKTARFTGQVIATAMSQGGDSGSLIVDATENRAVGLLFAGSNLATIFTPIDVVLSTLDISM